MSNKKWGQWSITIRGCGLHDNGCETDADLMANDLVGKLVDAGQEVRFAEFLSIDSYEKMPHQ
jgi:hypothetical protein